MLNIVFLGSLYPSDRVQQILSNSNYFDTAGHNFQNALIAGFDFYANVSIITAPRIKKYKSWFFKSSLFSHNNHSRDICLQELDIPAIKELLLTTSFISALRKITDIDIIVVYSTSFQALAAAAHYKSNNPSVKIINIITDLPQYMSTDNSVIYNTLKSIGIRMYYHLTKYIDGYVLLSSKMTELLPIKNKPWICIEGIYNNDIEVKPSNKNSEKVILYSGSLSIRYGILDLLEAFSMIPNQDFRLYLCGSGDAVNVIQTQQIIDPRIRYLGILNRAQVLRLQKEATVLVNPRNSKDEYTKYSFPSKTMEYMASGTPTLMSRLQCLPEEYHDYLYFFEDETPKGMRDKIIEICSKSNDELLTFGKKASEFIIRNKTNKIQASKIIHFVENI